MGTIKVSEIISRVGKLLQDESAVRWTAAELLVWYNEGLLDMVTRRPALLPSVDTFVCAAGAKQDIPADRIAVIDVGQNLGPVAKPRNGAVPKIYDKDLFDASFPDWQYASTATIVQAVLRHKTLGSMFWVFPPQPTSNPGRLTIIFSKRPTIVSDAAATSFECDDEYVPIALEYLLHRSCLKDSDNPTMAQRASQHLQNYLGLLGAGAPQPQQG